MIVDVFFEWVQEKETAKDLLRNMRLGQPSFTSMETEHHLPP